MKKKEINELLKDKKIKKKNKNKRLKLEFAKIRKYKKRFLFSPTSFVYHQVDRT